MFFIFITFWLEVFLIKKIERKYIDKIKREKILMIKIILKIINLR